jgi:hypothetical protein
MTGHHQHSETRDAISDTAASYAISDEKTRWTPPMNGSKHQGGGIRNKKFDGYRPIGRYVNVSSRTRHNVATNTKPERTIMVNCFT